MLNRILHVEDDADIQAIALMSLETLGGFTVHQCLTGIEALQQVESFAPDLFLLDMMMPDMSGLDTLLHLRQLPAFHGTPAIFMTAKAQPAEVRELIDAGALGVITKPFDPVTLPDQIRDLFRAAA